MKITGLKMIVFGLILIYLGWKLEGANHFFRVNYVIGVLGVLFGLWQVWRAKNIKGQNT